MLLTPSPAGAAFGSAPVNPATAPNGATAMHGDSAASDTTPRPGPGTGPLSVRTTPFAAACPSVLVGSDAMPIALCTKILGRAPQVAVLDPETGSALDTLDLPKGGLFSGVYTYLDDEDRLVLFDGRGDLLRIGHHRDASGRWRLSINEREPLGELISGHCGGNGCDAVVGISPDWQGRVWFATGGGVVGLYDPRKDRGRALTLGKEEYVDNSISTAPGVTAVATDHALYELHAGRDGRPHVVWRRAYDRGPARKPGQLSWGTGATPTYFGPRTGAEYLAIVDNASPTEHLMVYRSSAKGSRRAAKPGSVVCRTPVLSAFGSGTENSPIGSGRSVIVASTYGYPYPAYPDHAGESVPASAPFTGGMARVDVRRRGRGCITRWESAVRSAAVPKLSLVAEPPSGLARVTV